jgi:hypothetical protein
MPALSCALHKGCKALLGHAVFGETDCDSPKTAISNFGAPKTEIFWLTSAHCADGLARA